MSISSSDYLIDRSNCHNRHLASVFWSNRERLRRTVVNNLDRRLTRRVDPSDILQETYIEATRRLDKFIADEPMSTFDWLRLLARNTTRNANAFHLRAGKRSVKTERRIDVETANPTTCQSSPSHTLIKKELLDRRSQCMKNLNPQEQEVIRLRHEQNCSNADVALQLGISEKAASKRYYRAIINLARLMDLNSQGMDQ